jgi:hypothetical protein
MPELIERADKSGVIGARRGDDVLRGARRVLVALKQQGVRVQPVGELFSAPRARTGSPPAR